MRHSDTREQPAAGVVVNYVETVAERVLVKEPRADAAHVTRRELARDTRMTPHDGFDR
jgi:hypothetical protein